MIYKAFTIASSFKTVERVEIKEAGKVKKGYAKASEDALFG